MFLVYDIAKSPKGTYIRNPRLSAAKPGARQIPKFFLRHAVERSGTAWRIDMDMMPICGLFKASPLTLFHFSNRKPKYIIPKIKAF